MKTRISPVLITFALVCFALVQNTKAVVPPPDGCYPGFTTAEGCDALNFLTTGVGNTGVGWRSLFSAQAASFNTGVGAGTLVLNRADANTGVGTAALLLNGFGVRNTAVGTAAMAFNTGDGTGNGSFNCAFGSFALYHNDSGFSNNAFGDSALFRNIFGLFNTAVGDLALENNDATGNGQANYNTAVGAQALAGNIDGDSNNAVGVAALRSNTVGLFNEAMGVAALLSNGDGAANVAIGDSAMLNNTAGSFNTVIGDLAGSDITDGIDNIYIGATAGNGVGNESTTIRIGDPNYVTVCYVAGIFGQTAINGSPVFIDSTGKLATATSSARFKDNVKPMNNASDTIFALNPVTFRYKKEIDANQTPQFGLVAEEVARVDPDLVVRDRDGTPYTVRYDAVNAMLLNEFLKEHRTVQEQGETIAELKKQVTTLTATVREQGAQIQKVSAQLEASKPAPQVVNNP
jgi:trimeric autotransporter adhesin